MSKKIFGLVALFAAVVLLGGVRTAQAATAQELQDQINALLAQIGSLQGGSSTSCYSFTRDLTVGSQGADVTALQNYLAAKGYFNVAATGYFGAITAQAVASWQSAAGIMPAAGYFGAISRAKYNSMCSSTPSTGDDDDDTTGDDDDDFNAGNGEEASLEDYSANDGDDTDLEEGGSEQEVMEFEFDVEDADVEVQRVEVTFEFAGDTSNGERDPWKAFDGATLWMDGEEVASSDDLSDEDNWNEETGTDVYSFRFNGVDAVVGAGEKAEMVLSLDVQSGIDGTNNAGDNDWTIYIDDQGIRALDEAGIDQYTGENSESVDLSIEEAGGDDELSLSESDNDVDASVLEVDDSGTSDWHTLAVMQLSADMDIELKDFPLTVVMNQSGANDEFYSDAVNDLALVIDGEEYNDFDVTGAGTATATVTFDLDGEDIVINDGDDVEVEVKAEFKAISGSFDEGTTVTVNASSGLFETVDAEGVDSGEDLGTDQLSGSYEGEEHTLRSSGIILGLVDTDAVSPVGGDEAQAEFTIEFTVESFGQDYYIEKNAARDATGDVDEGVNFVIEDSAGTEYSTTTVTVTSDLQKSGNTNGDTATHYKVSEGQARTFTLTVSLDNEAASTEGEGFYRVRMTGVAFDENGAGAAADYVLTTGLEDFKTGTKKVDDADVAN